MFFVHVAAVFLLLLASLNAAQPPLLVHASQTTGKIVSPPAYDWPMFRRSGNHTGVVTSPAPLTNHVVRFVNLTESGTVRSSPALFNGILFIGKGGVFHALNASTMTYNATISQGWNYTLGGGAFAYSSPAVGAGSVFFGATDGRLYAFEAKIATCPLQLPACHMEWSFQTKGPILSSPTYDKGRVFIGCEGDECTVVNVVEMVGSERLMFSSDFPHEVNNDYCKNEIHELLENERLTTADKEAILFGNAQRFYQLRSI